MVEEAWAREQAAGVAKPAPELEALADLRALTAVELMLCRSREMFLSGGEPRAASP